MDFAPKQKGEPMTNGEAVNWLINISADIGKSEHRDLWHYEQALYEIREMLESAQPEHKTGKWIELTNTNHTYVCSVCGRMLVNITDGKNKVAEHYPYCHCGARMVQEGE